MRRLVAALVVGSIALHARGALADDPPPAPTPSTSPGYHPERSRPLFGPYVARVARQASPDPVIIGPYDPTPAGTHAEWRPRPGLTGGGIALLVSSYALAVTAVPVCLLDSSCSMPSSGDALFIPLIGPFVEMARTQAPGWNALLAVDGLAQLGGLAMIVAAQVFPQKVFVLGEASLHLSVAPARVGRGSGAVLVGTF